MYYVYLLKSETFNQTYTGSTNDLRRRLKEHNEGKSTSTRRYIPWRLVYYEAFEKETLARMREKKLKYNGKALKELKKRIGLVDIKNGAGYTLIEILVGLTIIGLLFGFGFVSFRDFSRRQAISGAAKEIQGDLRLAQGDAISGQKPDNVNCNAPKVLDSYSFKVYSGAEYKIEANCVGASSNAVVVKDVNLTSDIVIAIPSINPLLFKVLGQGTNIPSGSSWVLTLTQAGTNNKVNITVTSGGEIK